MSTTTKTKQLSEAGPPTKALQGIAIRPMVRLAKSIAQKIRDEWEEPAKARKRPTYFDPGSRAYKAQQKEKAEELARKKKAKKSTKAKEAALQEEGEVGETATETALTTSAEPADLLLSSESLLAQGQEQTHDAEGGATDKVKVESTPTSPDRPTNIKVEKGMIPSIQSGKEMKPNVNHEKQAKRKGKKVKAESGVKSEIKEEEEEEPGSANKQTKASLKESNSIVKEEKEGKPKVKKMKAESGVKSEIKEEKEGKPNSAEKQAKSSAGPKGLIKEEVDADFAPLQPTSTPSPASAGGSGKKGTKRSAPPAAKDTDRLSRRKMARTKPQVDVKEEIKDESEDQIKVEA